MKPDWLNAPEWANYLCTDAWGAWWWMENKPTFFEGLWLTPEQDTGKCEECYGSEPNIGYFDMEFGQSSLEERQK